MNLSDREKKMLKAMIDNGQPLPPKYRLSLFADAPGVELIWQGKTSEVTNVVLPFQSIEQIDEPRAEVHATSEKAMGTLDMFAVDRQSGRQTGGWTNKLFIDNCSYIGVLYCFTNCDDLPVGDRGVQNLCWTAADRMCEPCEGGWAGTAQKFDQLFSACERNCFTDADVCFANS